MKILFAACVVSIIAGTAVCAAEPVDLDMIEKIRDEGLNRSEVMESLRILTDEIGPRLTASPGMRAASKWSVEQLQEWGVQNVYLESFNFGRGWSTTRSEIHMTSPRQAQLNGFPVEWYPGTGGVLEGEIVHALISSTDDFADWEGKLQGKMVLIDEVQTPAGRKSTVHASYTREELDEIAKTNESEAKLSSYDEWAAGLEFSRQRNAFLSKEGALVSIRNNGRADMSINNSAYQYHAGMTPGIPSVVLATEHYERLFRLADNDHEVRLSVDVEATYYDEDHNGYSTIAEIPGEGSSPEVVMAGAHIDSHSSGDGAADNAAGVAVVMEAMRILKALDVQATRSIRIGLWSGEEQEYYGSGKHVRENYGHFPRKTDDMYEYVGDYIAADLSKPLVKARDYDRFSVYFNLDNGAGKIRGVYAQGNTEAIPIFESWLLPFQDIGATHVSLNYTGSTDHESFQLIGLPGYQFIQDRTIGNGAAHTQLDMYDEIYADDLKQASVVLASFLYHAAMRNERMPRRKE